MCSIDHSFVFVILCFVAREMLMEIPVGEMMFEIVYLDTNCYVFNGKKSFGKTY